jgi:rhodanese-related sulfurtransferase
MAELTQVSVVAAAAAVEGGGGLFLDVREPWEREQARIDGALCIAMGELPGRVDEIPADRDVYVYCQHGFRSLRVVAFLRQSGRPRAIDVAGGMEAWLRAGLPAVPEQKQQDRDHD